MNIIPWWANEYYRDENKYRPTYPDNPMIRIADLVNPDTGKTYQEQNTEKQHNIPIGTLVEILPDEDFPDECPKAGTRLFVVSHERDCDMTPLYSLCADSEDIIRHIEGFGNPKWDNGHPEYALRIIKLPNEL